MHTSGNTGSIQCVSEYINIYTDSAYNEIIGEYYYPNINNVSCILDGEEYGFNLFTSFSDYSNVVIDLSTYTYDNENTGHLIIECEGSWG